LTVWVTPGGDDRVDATPQRLAFGRPWRQTEGMLASILRLLGFDLPVPDHTTFSRRSAGLTVGKAVR
jgi:hypothetical protein